MNDDKSEVEKFFDSPNNLKLALFFINNPDKTVTQRELCEQLGREYNTNAYRENLNALKVANIIEKDQRCYDSRQRNTFEYSLNKSSDIAVLIHHLAENMNQYVIF